MHTIYESKILELITMIIAAGIHERPKHFLDAKDRHIFGLKKVLGNFVNPGLHLFSIIAGRDKLFQSINLRITKCC
jgi:hypothetical protein